MKTTVNIEINEAELTENIQDRVEKAKAEAINKVYRFVKDELQKAIETEVQRQIDRILADEDCSGAAKIISERIWEIFNKQLKWKLSSLIEDALGISKYGGNRRRISYYDFADKTEEYRKGFEDGINEIPFIVLNDDAFKFDQSVVEEALIDIVGNNLTYNLRTNQKMLDKLAPKIALELHRLHLDEQYKYNPELDNTNAELTGDTK